MKPWNMRGVEGVSRFLARVWRLLMNEDQAGDWELSAAVQDVDPSQGQQKITHATIKKVTEDIEALSFNTAISQMMIFVNAFTNAEIIPLSALRISCSAQPVRATSRLGVMGEAWRKVQRRPRRGYRAIMAKLRRTVAH